MKHLPKLTSLGVFAALSLAPVVAYAGPAQAGFFQCTKNADGSGNCQGTYNAARASSYTNDQVSFTMSTSGFAYFGAVYQGVSMSCTATATPGSLLTQVWAAALADRNYFYVNWDTNGTCTYAYIGNMSAYLSVL